MKSFRIGILAVLLGGCAAGLKGEPPDRLDLGLPVEAKVGWRDVVLDVRGAAWMDATTMRYRLPYADDVSVHHYARSRWVAPAVQMLGQRLRERIGVPRDGTGACRLEVDVLELAHVFESETKSAGWLDASATLKAGREVLGQRRFSLRVPATSGDSRGGARAQRDAANALGDGLDEWLAQVAAQYPSGTCPGKVPGKER